MLSLVIEMSKCSLWDKTQEQGFRPLSFHHVRATPPKYSFLYDIHCLKAVDTVGNCQRLAFTVGVSQLMHKITNL